MMRVFTVVFCCFVGMMVAFVGIQPAASRAEVNADFQIYSDGLEAGWQDWSWDVGSLDLCSTAEVYVGMCATAVDLNSYGGLSFYHADFGTNAWNSLAFTIHGGTTGGQQLQVFLHGPGGQDGSELPFVSLNNPAYINGGVVSAASWKQVNIPLGDLSGANTIISRVTIQAVGEQPLFHIDDMHLVGIGTPQNLEIIVDAGDIVGEIPRTVFGSNAATWTANLDQNSDIVNKVAASGVTVIRFPGGSYADIYDWQAHEAETPDDPNTTTTTEFIHFAQTAGAEPMITVNFGSGTAQLAADWVHFTNVENDWDVKYWEIGNEIYGDWEYSWTHDPTEYINGDATHDGFNDFCLAMKAVDPTIKVGAVGTLYPSGDYPDSTQYPNWGPIVLQLGGECMDFYTVHRYPFGPGNLDYVGLLADPPAAWPGIGDSVRDMIATNAPGQDIDMAVTEYNSYWDEPEILAIQTVNMLFLADTLGQIIEEGFIYANHWDIVNGTTPNNNRYGFLLEDLNYYRQPSYYVFPLWTHAGDQRISNSVNRDAGTQMTVYASRHSARGDVTLLVINKSEAETGTIQIDNFQAGGFVEAYVAQGDSLADSSVAYNGNENPPVDLSTVAPIITPIASGTFSYTFPAYSVTSLTVLNDMVMLPVIVAEIDANLTLRWSHHLPNTAYEVHRHEAPYFTPDGESQLATLNAPFADPVLYEDVGTAVGNVMLNHFYYVMGLTNSGQQGLSNHVGEFDFAIIPGS